MAAGLEVDHSSFPTLGLYENLSDTSAIHARRCRTASVSGPPSQCGSTEEGAAATGFEVGLPAEVTAASVSGIGGQQGISGSVNSAIERGSRSAGLTCHRGVGFT